MVAELATEIADPVARLRRIHNAMKSAKLMQQATPLRCSRLDGSGDARAARAGGADRRAREW